MLHEVCGTECEELGMRRKNGVRRLENGLITH